MELERRREGILIRAGEVKRETVAQFRQEIEALRYPGLVVVDFTGSEALDSTTLGVVIGALVGLAKRGGDVRLTFQSSRLRRIFEITGMSRDWAVYEDVEAAFRGPKKSGE